MNPSTNVDGVSLQCRLSVQRPTWYTYVGSIPMYSVPTPVRISYYYKIYLYT